ncbi:MAG: DNA repair protein [Pedobacter sp.]|nr:MAG: DNA repair protein [Pedobacter sp.]
MKKTTFPLSRVAEIKISYSPKFKACERAKVCTSQEVYHVLMQNWDQGLLQLQEQFKIILLNRNNAVLGICEVSRGGMSDCLVDVKLIFSVALKAGASGIVLSHNHPSGNLKASAADLQLTKKICEGGKLLDISVFDHLIISGDGYLSLADEALM